MTDSPTVGIVGAGLSGLVAGRLLQNHGLQVSLFDKGRRPGGRANTREHDRFRFDHGAQYFTARDPRVRALAASWVKNGIAAEWTGRLVRVQGGKVESAKASTRYVGVPGMISMAQELARDLDVRSGIRVEMARREDAGWSFHDARGALLGRFDVAVVAVPGPQAAPLLTDAPELRELARQVRMAPCWAGMYAFEEPLDLPFDGAFVSDGPFSWIARDSSKPGRPAVESWVLHAGPGWTRDSWDVDQEVAAALMLQGFQERFGPLPATTFRRAHRWAFALASDPIPGGALFSADEGIGACGDWCEGGRIEGALLSGIKVAGSVMGMDPSHLDLERIASHAPGIDPG